MLVGRFRRHPHPDHSGRPLFQRPDLQEIHIEAQASLEDLVTGHLQARRLADAGPHNKCPYFDAVIHQSGQ